MVNPKIEEVEKRLKAAGHDPLEFRKLESLKKDLTLRDYFAGQALASMLSAPTTIENGTPALAAKLAFKFADAMLAARRSEE